MYGISGFESWGGWPSFDVTARAGDERRGESVKKIIAFICLSCLWLLARFAAVGVRAVEWSRGAGLTVRTVDERKNEWWTMGGRKPRAHFLMFVKIVGAYS